MQAAGSSEACRRRVIYVGASGPRAVELLSSLAEAGYETEHVREPPNRDRSAVSMPDIVLVDGDRLDPSSGRSTEVCQLDLGCPIVVLSGADQPFDVLAAVQSGVAGICALDAPADAVVRTVDDVLAFGASIPRKYIGMLIAQLQMGRGRLVPVPGGEIVVTEREWEVLVRLSWGWTTKRIAEDLYVSRNTVRSHVLGLVRKFEVRNRKELLELCHLDHCSTSSAPVV